MRRCGLLLIVVVVVCTGCVKEDADRLQRVAHRAGNDVNAAGGNAWGKLSPRWERVQATPEQTLETRVRQRLQWDKSLAGARIEPKATGNTIELQGTLTNPNQRRQAVTLTQSTVGVEQVVDRLTE